MTWLFVIGLWLGASVLLLLLAAAVSTVRGATTTRLGMREESTTRTTRCPWCEAGIAQIDRAYAPFKAGPVMILPPGWETCRKAYSTRLHLIDSDTYLDYKNALKSAGDTQCP